jgi:dTDP-4-amino-4,6-dideoxygalactose transaminase
MVTTSDDAAAERIRRLRHHGQGTKDLHDEVGFTSRLDDLQAAVLRVKLRHLDTWTKARRQVASWYREALADLPIQLPVEREWAEAVYHLFVVRLDRRDEVMAALRADGIGCTVHYATPMHRQPAVLRLGIRPPALPVAEQYSSRAMSLPVYPTMGRADVDAVAQSLARELR